MPTWPVPELGFMAFAKPIDELQISGGVYGGELTGRSFSDAGLFSGEVFSIVQIQGNPTVAGRDLIVQLGAWLTTTETPALRGPRVYDWNYGPYLILDQELLRDADGSRSLRAWVQFTWAPPDRSANSWWLGGGLVWTGVLPFFEGDKLGIGVLHAQASPENPGTRGGETVIELFYKVDVTPWLQLQPDLQTFVNPAADGRTAFVLGLRTVLTF